MSGGGSGSNSGITRVEPPNYQLPYLQAGLGQAQSVYNQGTNVVPFAPQTEQALAGIEQRATQGSPVTSAAQNYVTRGLNSSPSSMFGSAANPYASGANPYGGASNPYLDATFNQAAQSTQNRLASEFAGAGRNIDASQPVRSEQLNNLATQIYGGAYENERNRQLQYQSQLTGIGATGYENERSRQLQDLGIQRQAQLGMLGSAIPLAQQDYADLSALEGVGGRVEDLAQQYANAQGTALDQYLGRVRGTDYGSTQIGPPQSRNRGAGALGGAMAGAQVGSYFGPWGTAIGAVGGGLLGGWG